MSGYGGAQLDQNQKLEYHLGGKNFLHDHGAPFGLSRNLPWFFRRPSIFRTNRKRLNGTAMLVSVLVPWVVFCMVFYLMSFKVHYDSPWACWSLTALIFLLSVGASGLLLQVARVRRERDVEEQYEPMWYGFLCITCFLGIVVGIALGFHNFARTSQAYEFQNLATYHDIDPANYVGQQLVDAGRVQFSDKAYLDIGKSMGFKDSDIYCVAPIVSPKSAPESYVDFWAVGKNCCSGVSADFHCKGYLDTHNKGGLRLMDDSSRPFYRLAVQQAEATYKIKTHKPLFFVWGEDPIKHTDDLQHNAYTIFICGLFAALIVQLFLVITATLVFAKIFPSRS